jgi:hypothetical protein
MIAYKERIKVRGKRNTVVIAEPFLGRLVKCS